VSEATTTYSPGIYSAHVADRATLEANCGQRIHPKAFEIHPQGNRLVVVVDIVPETLGGIHLPDTVRDSEQMGQGWILSVGPTAFQGNIPHPGSPRADNPSDLVGCHIYFGTYIGKPLRLTLNDNEYKAGLLLMTDRDILAIDTLPENDPIADAVQSLVTV
jgi:co-chaperonin GroES (HSP10)